jgi:hypothetical protein
MTLEEALKAKHLMLLVPFHGWKRCGRLTGKFFYDTATGKEDPNYIKVEVKTGIFSKEWVYLSNLQEIKEVVKGENE